MLYPFVFFRYVPDDVLFRHEMEHVYQIMRDGWLVFYVRYLWWHFLYGYANNPYEIEARERASEPLTKTERRFYVQI